MMLQTIKKSIIGWIVFSLTVVLVFWIWYAAITNIWTNTSTLEVTSWSTLSADSWNKLLGNFEFLKSKTDTIDSRVTILEGVPVWAPNFDSWWIAVQSNTSNVQTLTHNFWTLPKNIVLYTSSTNDGTWARWTPLISPWLSYNSPETNIISSTDIKLYFHNLDNVIYCDVNNICPSWVTTSKTWYMRVFAWK